MLEKRYDLVLDVYHNGIVDTPIHYVQGDEQTGFIDFKMYKRTTKFDLTEVTSATIVIKKPDGNIVVSSTTDSNPRLVITDVVNGLITYELGTQDISVEGECVATISLLKDGERLTSCRFDYAVIGFLDSDGQSTVSTSANSFNQRIKTLEDSVIGRKAIGHSHNVGKPVVTPALANTWYPITGVFDGYPDVDFELNTANGTLKYLQSSGAFLYNGLADIEIDTDQERVVTLGTFKGGVLVGETDHIFTKKSVPVNKSALDVFDLSLNEEVQIKVKCDVAGTGITFNKLIVVLKE